MKILLLEDDIVLTAELNKYLMSHNWQCRPVFDGEQFLAESQKNAYDVYLLDINVPKLNGFEVCERIRRTDNVTPILMISAYGDIADKRKAFERLADDYLVKPFQFDELLLRIQSVARRQRSGLQEDILQVEDLVINKTRQRVERAGKEIPLTMKEFQLLVYLAEAKGKTVSKQEITAHVWEHNFNTNTNTVEVYINFLRKKIDKNFVVKLIHTRSGFGYYLRALS